MLWIRYDCAEVAEKIPEFDKVLLEEEGSGILNWAIEGACKLLKHHGRIPRSEVQLKRIDDLLRESDSAHAFVTSQLEKAPAGKVLSAQLYIAYLKFCDSQDWEPLPERKATRQIKQEIETLFHIEQRHDLTTEYGNNVRGYSGIQFK